MIAHATALLLGAVAARALPAATPASLAGTWQGTVTTAHARAHGTASGTLVQADASVTGTIDVELASGAASFAVAGVVRGARVRLRGSASGARIAWRARWDDATEAWRGRVVVRGGRRTARGLLVLAHPGAAVGVRCGDAYFASDVMPRVMDRLCIHCHVPGGVAAGAAFRVTPGDATATATSALGQVDRADPSDSRIIEKPLAGVAHGGGRQIQPGSPEEQVLLAWIVLATAPGCDPGGSDPPAPPPDDGAGLYAASCASCHGPDATGTGGRPAIRCTRDITDAVRNGRTGGAAGDMPAFPALSDADVAKIQSFLDGLCPATGPDLFAGNCAICHGDDATGTPTAPGVRCATRTADAVRTGRGAAMPAFPALTDADVALVEAWLADVCTRAGRPGAELFAGNCATCHGATGGGGRNALGVRGPDVRCSGAGDVGEVIRRGTDRMPAFPALDAHDAAAIAGWLSPAGCVGGD